MVCDTELSTAISCVTGDVATCGSCIDLATYADEFPKNAENAFRSTLAFKPPTDPEICLEANYRTCKPWAPIKDGAHSCCCLAEQEAYIGCQFDTTWLTKYSISDSSCEWYGCDRVMGGQPENAGAASGGGDSGGFLSSTMIIIIGSSCGGLLLLLLCIFLFCRSRRQRILVAAAAASKLDDKNKDKSSTSKGSGKDKKGKDKKKDKKKGKKVRYSMDRIICVIFSKRLDTARHATSSARS
jgi:hypothetical protein